MALFFRPRNCIKVNDAKLVLSFINLEIDARPGIPSHSGEK